MTRRYAWTELDSNIEVFGEANFAECNSTRTSTVGGVAMWSGQFMKAWFNTMKVLALSSEESELAAGLQSIFNDICLCNHVAIKSDATAAIGMFHGLGLGKVRHLAVGDLWVQHHVRSDLCELQQNTWVPLPKPLVVDSGAGENSYASGLVDKPSFDRVRWVNSK